MLEGKILRACYEAAGNDLLADRLVGMFRVLESPEDVALHNAVTREVMEMVGPDKTIATMFYRLIAKGVFEREINLVFRKIVAEGIIGVARCIGKRT